MNATMIRLLLPAAFVAFLAGCGDDCRDSRNRCFDACPVTVEVTHCFTDCMEAEGNPCVAEDEAQ